MKKLAEREFSQLFLLQDFKFAVFQPLG